MSLGKQDRLGINTLLDLSHGTSTVPRNVRDASTSASSSSFPQGPWKRKETLITAPSPGARQSGNPYNAASIRSSLGNSTRGRSSGVDRAPTLQSNRTILGMTAKPGQEYQYGRAPKRQKVVDEKYRAASGALPKTSPHFQGNSAGRGKAAKGGPKRSTRQIVNLNKGEPETLEVPDSEEDREEVREEKRQALSSKSAGKRRVLPKADEEEGPIEVMDEDEDVIDMSQTASYMCQPPAPEFDFENSCNDARSSGTPPARISHLQSSKAAANKTMSDDELDVIGADERPRAGSATARVEADLRNAPSPSTGRAPTRPALQPVSKVASGPSASQVNVISSDESEVEVEVEAQPTKRMATPSRSCGPSVKGLVDQFENNDSSTTAASTSVKSRMQVRSTRNTRSDWGSVPGGMVTVPQATMSQKRDLSGMKIPKKNKTPADDDLVATSATPYVRPGSVTSTSAPPSTTGDSRSTGEDTTPSSRTRAAPTPIATPSGSVDDPEIWIPLRYCALGFKRLPVDHSDNTTFSVALTRNFQKLYICRMDKSEIVILFAVPLKDGQFEKAIACFGSDLATKETKKNDMPFVQFIGFTCGARLSGTMMSHVDRNNDRGANTLTIIFESEHTMWNSRYYDRLLRHLAKDVVPKKVDQVAKPGVKSLLDAHDNACDVYDRELARQAVPRSSDLGPRKPRPLRPIRPKGSGVQTTLKAGMQQQMTLAQPLRRSARNSGPSNLPEREAIPDADEVILVYPPSGRGSVNITNGDLGRLAPGDYLNDSLIEFGLKIWLDELRETQPELADQIHVFSSFFYKKLGSNAETGYASVRKWTNKIDIFKKKYLVIPINENFHWYLAIIYEPNRVLLPPPPLQLRHSTRLQGDKPDAAQSVEAGATLVASSAHESDDVQRSSRDMREEMEVDRVLSENLVAGDESPLSDLDLIVPRSSSPVVRADVEMEDVSHEAGPSRSSVETLDDPPLAGSVPHNDASMSEEKPVNGAVRAEKGSVDAVKFYAQALPPRVDTKGKGKARASEVEYIDFEDDGDVTAGVAAMDMTADDMHPMEDDVPPKPGDPLPAFVFTFDSLGGRHPTVGKKLGQYLHLEAHDKLDMDSAALSPCRYMAAQVPTQPNSCDCGVYLLHFAKQFMKNAEDIVTHITTKQASRGKAKSAVLDQHWDPEAVNRARGELRELILKKSDVWKIYRMEEKVREQKEKEQKEREQNDAQMEGVSTGTGAADGAEGVINVDASDDEIEVLDAPSPKRGPRGGRKSAGGTKQYVSRRRKGG